MLGEEGTVGWIYIGIISTDAQNFFVLSETATSRWMLGV